MIGWTREVIELTNLAFARFTDLTESELKVLVAVTTGETAYCGPSRDDKHPHNNRDYADFWGPERDIRAELIRWLCINHDAAAWVDPRGLRIHAARIGGALNLSYAVVRFPLYLLGCRIANAMDLHSSQIEFLQLSGSIVHGLVGDAMRVRGSLNLRGGFRADGEVRLLGANIEGILDCSTGELANRGGIALHADRVKVTGGVFFRNGFNAEGEVRLAGADIGGSLDCDGGKFVKPGGYALNAYGAKVAGPVFLRHGFTAEGEVTFVGAEIGGSLECDNGKFAKADGYALNAGGAEVAGSVSLRNGFSAKGEVNLLGAKIGGTLECGKGKFVKPNGFALNADRAKVGGSVFMRNGFSADGGVNLIDADIGSNLEVTRVEFAAGSRFNAQRATVKGGFFWRQLGCDVKAALDLRYTLVGAIADDQNSWPTMGNLKLDGFVYAGIGAGPTDAKTRLDWLARQPADKFTPQPYQQLAKLLREAGDSVGARRVLVAMENSRHKHEKLGFFGRPWHRILWATIGYGYRPGRALWCALGIVTLGLFLFGFGYRDGAVTPIDKDAYQAFEKYGPKQQHGDPPWYYQKFSAPVYSLDTFLPIINFGQKDHWMPNPHNGSRLKPRWARLASLTRGWFTSGWPTTGWLLRCYLWFHIAAGWTLTTLFVTGFTSIVRNE